MVRKVLPSFLHIAPEAFLLGLFLCNRLNVVVFYRVYFYWLLLIVSAKDVLRAAFKLGGAVI